MFGIVLEGEKNLLEKEIQLIYINEVMSGGQKCPCLSSE